MNNLAKSSLLCLTLGLVMTRASATTFDLSASGANVSISAVFTASADGTGSYQVTGISGSFLYDGVMSTIDSATFEADPSEAVLLSPSGLDNYDQLYTPSATPFDYYGLWFQDTAGDDIVLYSTGPVNSFSTSAGGVGSPDYYNGIDIKYTEIAATPEPSGLILLGTGVIPILEAVRRRILKS